MSDLFFDSPIGEFFDDAGHTLYDLMKDIIPEQWMNSVHANFHGLTDEEIFQSVREASVFFNMNDPVAIREGFTTGVFTNSFSTPDDDVLIYSKSQMENMGITDKEGFDLVMTHEAAHRMLQNFHSDPYISHYTPHQEELCCDYMAGVRAGLNHMDFSKMENSLVNRPESDSHPSGPARVSAIERGVHFANQYMHDYGKAPTFADCLADFDNIESFHGYDSEKAKQEWAEWHEKQAKRAAENGETYKAKEELRTAEVYRNSMKHFADDSIVSHIHGGEFGNATGDYIDDSHPSDEFGHFHGYDSEKAKQEWAEWHEKQAKKAAENAEAYKAKEELRTAQSYRNSMKKFDDGLSEIDILNNEGDSNFKGMWIDDREWHIKRANDAKHDAEWHRKQASSAINRGDLSCAKDHEYSAKLADSKYREELSAASRCTK